MDMDEAMTTPPLTDNDDPQMHSFHTDSVDPSRMKPLSEKVEPKFTKSRTDSEEPKRVIP
jgi:hypothetical protein